MKEVAPLYPGMCAAVLVLNYSWGYGMYKIFKCVDFVIFTQTFLFLYSVTWHLTTSPRLTGVYYPLAYWLGFSSRVQVN